MNSSLHRALLALAVTILSLNPSFGQDALVQSGPMVGYAEMTEVMLWAQTKEPADVQFRYWDLEKPGEKLSSTTVKTVEDQANVAHVLITGLRPGRRYGYELVINRQAVRTRHDLRFQTPPLWQWRTDPPAFSVAFGSCAYINEAEWDRPGTPYGSDYEVFTAITTKKPDLMLWLGDNTYYREIDWNTRRGLRHRQTHTRSIPELQPLLGATHHYAIWDDHDYGPNDADRSYRLKEASLETHKLFWANQLYGTAHTPGVFSRFEWADVEFFLLDDRYHRSPNQSPDDSQKTMFGPEQLQWLKDALVSSRATFKIVVNGNQILNPISPFEALSRFTTEYRDLLAFIKRARIPGLVFLSGDRHFSELICLRDSTFYPLYDYTSSSLTAGLFTNPEKEKSNPNRVAGTLVTDAHNFGLLRFSGPQTDRTLTLECFDDRGDLRWSHAIRARELRAP